MKNSKRIYLLMVTVLCAVSLSAQNIQIWKGGYKILDTRLTNVDSITFVLGDQPVTPDTGSVTPPDTGSVTPPASISFDYNHWREINKVNMFISDNGGYWDSISLPWAPVAVTSIDSAYRKPNLEDKWELAFNLLSDKSLAGVHMFGLWDRKSNRMRIYAYLENQPASAKYCFFRVTSSTNSMLDRDLMMWMPSEAAFHNTWNAQALSSDRVPSTKTCQIMPITGTIGGQVNRGWLCFEMNFSSGLYTVPASSTINFTLYAVEDMSFSGEININEYMETQEGSLTIPGNKYREAAGCLQGIGNLFTGIGNGLSSKNAAAGGMQMAGACVSFAGDIINAWDEGEDKKYTLDLSFHTTGTDKFHGSLTQTISTNMPPVTIEYSQFLKEVLTHASESEGGDNLTVGAWNLQRQPVMYVCKDASFIAPDEMTSLYASFLDPTSIQIALNEEDRLFEDNDLDSVKVLAYDFAFVSPKYTFDNQPYYNFYGIQQDALSYAEIQQCRVPYVDYKIFLLDTTATYEKLERLTSYGHNSYTGTTVDMPAEYEMDVYNLAFCPAIGQYQYSKTTASDNPFRKIGVSVVLELKYKNGEGRIFAERFLPQIKSFTLAQALGLMDSLNSIPKATQVGNVPLLMPLYDQQMAKAQRMLSIADRAKGLYTIVPVSQKSSGLRIRAYQDENTPGIVIRTINTFSSNDRYYDEVLKSLHSYLDGINNWDAINSLLTNNDMISLDHYFHCLEKTVFSDTPKKYNLQTGAETPDMATNDAYPIEIYLEDAAGNLTLLSYDAKDL